MSSFFRALFLKYFFGQRCPSSPRKHWPVRLWLAQEIALSDIAQAFPGCPLYNVRGQNWRLQWLDIAVNNSIFAVVSACMGLLLATWVELSTHSAAILRSEVHTVNQVVQQLPFKLQLMNWCIIVRRQNPSHNATNRVLGPQFKFFFKFSGIIKLDRPSSIWHRRIGLIQSTEAV